MCEGGGDDVTHSVDVLDRHVCALGEGPMWDERTGEAFWVDIPAGAVHALHLASGSRRTLTASSILSAIVPREGAAEGWLVSLEHGPALLAEDGSTKAFATYAEADGRPAATRVRSNDAKCDPRGRYWLGTMAWDGSAGGGALYRLGPTDRLPVRQLSGVSVSNGLGWSPDETKMYYVDSATQRIDTFDFDVDEGVASRRRPLVDIPPGWGTPDGLAIDSEGCLWVVLHDGGRVHRYTAEGRLDRVIELPARRVTSCAFAGYRLDQLVVTSARGESGGSDPLGGATFVVDVGVNGAPTVPFVG